MQRNPHYANAHHSQYVVYCTMSSQHIITRWSSWSLRTPAGSALYPARLHSPKMKRVYAPCGKSVDSFFFRCSADGTKSRRQSVVVQIDRTDPRSTSNSAVITHFHPVRSVRTCTKGIITELDLLGKFNPNPETTLGVGLANRQDTQTQMIA